MSVDGLHNIGEINIKVSACFFGKLVLTFGLAACDSQVGLKAACDFGKCSESRLCHVHCTLGKSPMMERKIPEQKF
jgi:hypothetical protein